MKVVLLCGGYGTRIRDVTDDLPKPMIPIGNFPILWHIMKYYAHWGHEEFVLCLGYKGHTIRDFFLNYDSNISDFTITLGTGNKLEYHNRKTEENWKVTLAETGLTSLTGARIKKIKKYLMNEKNFMLTYGDGVGDIDIEKLVRFHLSHGKVLTVTGVHPPGRFGEIMSESNGTVLEFNEKPQAHMGRISGGFFVCRREIFDYLDDRDDLVFEVEPINRLVNEKQMMVYEHDGFWQPMDTYRDYKLLKTIYEKDQAPWVVW
jgi:glucose-1-phosphate cytidylyltransferase